MELINFFEEQVNKWNENKQCGQCYEFHAPLTEEALNKQQLKNPCCVQVLLTRDNLQAFGINRTYNNQLGIESDVFEFKNFKLLFALPMELGLNNHTEILNHSIELTRSKVLQDLESCLTRLELDFCEFLGTQWQVTQWTAQQVINIRDTNYTGYRINVSIRKRIK